MKVNSISFNNSNVSNRPSFQAVHTQPYPETLKVIRYNISRDGMLRLGDMTHHLEFSKNWDMHVWGYNGRLQFSAISKKLSEKLDLNLLEIEPEILQPDKTDKEFKVNLIKYNHDNADRPFKNCCALKLKFNDFEYAKKAYETLRNNYQAYVQMRMIKSKESNFKRIAMAEENFNILENAEVV